MVKLTIQEAVTAAVGRLIAGNPDALINGVSTDTRTIDRGMFFIALKGERFDGHDFLKDALTKADGAIVSKTPVDLTPGKAIIQVSDTLKALQALAKHARIKSKIKVIGVTGTNGKTTTKEMAASVASVRFKTHKNIGNLNNQIGLPLSILSMEQGMDIAVLEMGASRPGDIAELCEIAMPDIGVITNIGMAHIEGFGGIEGVRRAKMEMLNYASKAALNADDEFMMQGAAEYKGNIVKYGIKAGGLDVWADGINLMDASTEFNLNVKNESARVRLNVGGLFNVYNALAASGAGCLLGMDAQSIAEGLNGFQGVKMRVELSEINGATVIADCYNANPASMRAALMELKRLKKARSVAVLGDMLELGAESEPAHRELGRLLAGTGVDFFIAVGPMMRSAADEFVKSGGRAAIAVDSAEAMRLFSDSVRPGDTVLVKGSRGMRMERVFPSMQKGERAMGGNKK